MDLADFPHRKVLELYNLDAVTGYIRDISENDFSSLESLILPKSVYGGRGYELQRISDALLDLRGSVESVVTGDIRDIENNDFSSLERLTLPTNVYGAAGSKLRPHF